MKIVLALISLWILSCQTKPVYNSLCDELDWFELGRRDGAQGLSSRFNKSFEQYHCGLSPRLELARRLYQNGRNAGLMEFCSPDNAYEFGLSGHTYNNVCPVEFESQFLSRYREGFNEFENSEASSQL